MLLSAGCNRAQVRFRIRPTKPSIEISHILSFSTKIKTPDSHTSKSKKTVHNPFDISETGVDKTVSLEANKKDRLLLCVTSDLFSLTA